MTYQTNNPVGSVDVRDLYDNAEAFDNFSAGPLDAYPDRFGVPRQSLQGIRNASLYTDIGPYAAGLNFTALNQVFSYDAGSGAEFYAPGPAIALPYTTTGAGAGEIANFRSVGDAVLRSDLAASAGASLVSFDEDETYPVGSVGARLLGTVFSVDMFGASPSNPDNTAAYNALVAAVPEGATVRWGKPGQVYVGNFSSPTKSLRLDLNGAILRDFTTTTPVVSFGSLAGVVAHQVIEAALPYGSTTFQVAGASGLFSAGDIGYLWDGATRPSDAQPVNFEVVKIQAVSGNVVTVAGFLASYKGAGTIRFYRHANQLRGIRVTGGGFMPTSGHIEACVVVNNSAEIEISNLKGLGFTGPLVSVNYCYDVNIARVSPIKPAATGSGQGYGVSLYAVSRFSVEDVHGQGCRHVYDQDSAYFGHIDKVSDMDDQSAAVVLAHNGFSGHISCSNVRAVTPQYSVSLGEQGYGGAVNAERGKHPFRCVSISSVDSTSKAAVNSLSGAGIGVYFQNSISDCSVDGILVRHLDTATLTTGNSCAVRIDGSVSGMCSVNSVTADQVGYLVFALGNRGTLPVAFGDTLAIADLHADRTVTPVLLQGIPCATASRISLKNTPISGRMLRVETAYGRSPLHAEIDGLIYSGAECTLIESDVLISGGVPLQRRGISSGVPVTAGSALTAAQVQNTSQLITLIPGVGAGTTTLGANPLPSPVFRGATLFVTIPPGYNTVAFPSGANNTAFSISPGVEYKLVARDGVTWSPLTAA